MKSYPKAKETFLLSKPLLLRGGRVVTMDPSRRILEADVLVEQGRIKSVGRLERGKVGKKKPAVVDCTGLIVLPGLIQAHIHLCQTLFRGLADDLALEAWLAQRIWPLEAAHTAESIYASAQLGAAELLLGGTTTILDMETVRHTGAAFEALESIGIRATAGKCLMDAVSSPAAWRRFRRCSPPAAAWESARMALPATTGSTRLPKCDSPRSSRSRAWARRRCPRRRSSSWRRWEGRAPSDWKRRSGRSKSGSAR